MDFPQTEKLLASLGKIIDHPFVDNSPRAQLSALLSISALEFAASTRMLCGEHLLLGASATLRSQFEALVRSAWALHRATDSQVERLMADLSIEAQQASKNIPTTNQMLSELEKSPQLHNLLIPLNEFKTSSWGALNSFVHSGIHAVHWTKYEAPPHLLEQVFRISNGLAGLAYMNIGILTGIPNIQRQLIEEQMKFLDVLPAKREEMP